jgi:hypothetical protein
MRAVNWNRFLSGAVAVVYLTAGYFAGGWELVWRIGLSVLFLLACIWFADAMGDFVGPTSGGAITAPSPGWLVCLLAWIILLLPAIIAVAYMIMGGITR